MELLLQFSSWMVVQYDGDSACAYFRRLHMSSIILICAKKIEDITSFTRPTDTEKVQ
jgi:hypothetical protein